MLKALSLSIERIGFSRFASSARMIAVRSARLIVCRSYCDLISMCVVVCVAGSTIDAPSVELPGIWDPSV